MTSPPEVQKFPTSLEEMESVLEQSPSVTGHLLNFDAQDIRAHEGKLFVESSAAQWLATWTRSRGGRVKIHAAANEPPVDVLRRVSDTLPGALLGMLGDQTIEGITKAPLIRFRDAFFKQQQSWPDLSVRDYAALLCLDSIPASVGLPPQLYPKTQKGKVASREQFAHLVDQLMKAVTSETNIRGSIVNRREQLTTILHELFKNTHDHARTSVDKQLLPLSIRGPYARFYPAEQLAYTALPTQRDSNGNEIIPNLNQAEQFASFFVRPRVMPHQRHTTENERRFLGLLELSVFDTGPGFAATYLKEKFENASAQEQFEAVLGCFATGRSATGDESRGYGLWKVLRDLRDLKGFIRLRTNRVHVYRDFAWYSDMFMRANSDIVAPKERLMDWRRGITQKITEGYPDMQGAHVAVLIPLGDNL